MILVTGGSGLIGSHLLYKLCASGEHAIIATYRNKEKIQNVKNVFSYYDKANHENLFSKITWTECDVLDLPTLEEVIRKCDYIYHCAAKVSYQRKDFNSLISINREGTANIVNMALKHGVKKLCHVSSTAAIGKPVKETKEPLNEDAKWNPDIEVSGYSMSKYLSEKEVWRGVEEGLDAVIINPSVVFGPGDWNESSLTILNTLKKGMKFYPPGGNAFIDARDLGNIMYQLMNSDLTAERYLCIGENASFKKMMATAAKHLQTKEPSIKLPKWLMNLAWRMAKIWSMITFSTPVLTKESVESTFETTVYSCDKIKSALNYEFYNLDQMLANTIQEKQ